MEEQPFFVQIGRSKNVFGEEPLEEVTLDLTCQIITCCTTETSALELAADGWQPAEMLCFFCSSCHDLHVVSAVFVRWMCSHWSVRCAQMASSLRSAINDPSASKLPERKRTWVY